MDRRPTMNLSRFHCSLLLVAVAAFAQEKEYKPKEEKLPGPPVAQPIAYSHKTHVAMGMKCTNCHTMPGDGFAATFPKETMCMGCHTTVKKESPEIQKLAAFAAKKEPVPWVRIYRVPRYRLVQPRPPHEEKRLRHVPRRSRPAPRSLPGKIHIYEHLHGLPRRSRCPQWMRRLPCEPVASFS